MPRSRPIRSRDNHSKSAAYKHHQTRQKAEMFSKSEAIESDIKVIKVTSPYQHRVNNMMELGGGAEISGIKLHAAIDVLIRRNHIHHNTMGIWLDWEAQGARITQNLLHDNDVPEVLLS